MIPLHIIAASKRRPSSGGGSLIDYVGYATSLSSLTSHTFTAIPAGTPNPGSEVIICAMGAANANRNVSSATINNAAPTFDTANYGGYFPGVIIRGPAPASTVDATVNFNGGAACIIFVYRTSGPVTLTGSSRFAQGGATTLTRSVGTAAGGMLVALGGASQAPLTWGGPAKVDGFDGLGFSTYTHETAAMDTGGATQDVTITVPSTAILGLHVAAYAPA